MFHKLLIANRGEIALRILRSCRELGIRAVIAHSKVDAHSLPVRLADESICIGPADAPSSYLNIPSIIAAAEITDAEAIHPGYGFLSENSGFAEICQACRITFIGPPVEAIRLMGDKVQARESARRAGVPLLPGSRGALPDDETQVLAIADAVGYPVMLKAGAGGGGRGMRIVGSRDDLLQAVAMCRAEAVAAFGSGELYLEQLLEGARHIEVQVLGDKHGRLIHLGERDCSIQRRYQKLLEESPAPAISGKTRDGLAEAALALAGAINYENAGTIEFLVDEAGSFYFLEMNTRIQVEHPVTEMVTGIDLVREQIRIAAGEPLGYDQSAIRINGHAIECRVNAEDPVRFVPSPGTIHTWIPPGGFGVRVDSHCFPSYVVPPNYDSLLAKLIAHGRDRAEAIERMRRALGEFVVDGVKTTIPFHLRLLHDPAFVAGGFALPQLERSL